MEARELSRRNFITKAGLIAGLVASPMAFGFEFGDKMDYELYLKCKREFLKDMFPNKKYDKALERKVSDSIDKQYAPNIKKEYGFVKPAEVKKEMENIAIKEVKEYEIEKNKDYNYRNELRFGIASDIHDERSKAERVANVFLREDVDAILLPGDFSNYSFININLGEERQVKNSLIPFLDTKKPVYIIPGNHESRLGYYGAVKDLRQKYSNLYDLSKLEHVKFKGVNLLGIPGGDIPAMGGFQIKSYIDDIEKKLRKLDDAPKILLTHLPPRFGYDNAIDCTYDVVLEDGDVISGRHRGEKAIYSNKAKERINPKNRGLRDLTELVNSGIDFSVSGHFHGNYGASDLKQNLYPKKYSNKLHMNPGAVKFERAGFLTLKDGAASYELFKAG